MPDTTLCQTPHDRINFTIDSIKSMGFKNKSYVEILHTCIQLLHVYGAYRLHVYFDNFKIRMFREHRTGQGKINVEARTMLNCSCLKQN